MSDQASRVLITAVSAIAFCAFTTPLTSFAAQGNMTPSQQELQRLKAQAQQLQQQVDTLSEKLAVKSPPALIQGRAVTRKAASTQDDPVSGPHFGIDATYDGQRLVVNEPSIHKDLGLLKQKQLLNQAFGSVGDRGSRVQLSGLMAADAYTHSNAFGKDEDRGQSTLYASGELDIAAQANDWWTAFTQFTGDSDDNSVQFKQGFVTVGNLDRSPMYGTVGQYYVPNGGYSSDMLTSSLPKSLGRTRARALTLGYMAPQGWHGAVFGQVGRTDTSNNEQIDQWGADFRYQAGDFKAGLSYQSNLGSSDGMKQPFSNSHTKIDHYVDAVDARASYNFKPFTLSAEYLTALESFSTNDVAQNGTEIKPSASLLESTYSFQCMGKPSYMTFSYGRTNDSLAMKLPRYQYGATYGVHVYKNTIIALEYMQKRDYARNDSTVAGTNAVSGTGNRDHAITAEVDVYF